MKKTITIIFALFLITPLLKGQSSVRGYLGKKNLVSYNLGFNPKLQTWSDFDPGNLGSLNHRLQYERVVGKKVSLIGFVEYASYKTMPLSYFYMNGFNDPITPVLDIENDPTGNSTVIGIKLRFYSKLNAPMGRYWGFYVSYGSNSMVTPGNTYKIGNSSSSIQASLANEISSSSSNGRVGIELGANRILSKYIFFDYGVDLGIAFANNPFFTDGSIELESSDYSSNYEEFLEALDDVSSANFASKSYINFRLSIGYIL